MEVWQTSNLQLLRLGKEKKEERTNDRIKIYTWSARLHRATINQTPVMVNLGCGCLTHDVMQLNIVTGQPHLESGCAYSTQLLQKVCLYFTLVCVQVSVFTNVCFLNYFARESSCEVLR